MAPPPLLLGNQNLARAETLQYFHFFSVANAKKIVKYFWADWIFPQKVDWTLEDGDGNNVTYI